MSGILHEDLRSFYCCRRQYIAIKALPSFEIVPVSYDRREVYILGEHATMLR